MTGVHLWWFLLSLASLLNIGLWIYSASIIFRYKSTIHPEIVIGRLWLLSLSGIYTAVCAFRSFLPRIDLERISLVDSWLSNMFIGRSAATVAEIAFIFQCAILLREAALGAKVKTAIVVVWLIIPLVFIAEGFSWYAILTTNYFGSMIEESLWAVMGLLVLISFTSLWPQVHTNHRIFLSMMIAYGVGFVIFMVTVDIPMYWTRWLQDSANAKTYLSLSEGFLNTVRDYQVSFEWPVWREEIAWMTLYFTVTVWVSIGMTHAPDFTRGAGLRKKTRSIGAEPN